MGLNPSTSLHDVRWGDPWGDDFVWIMEISGSVPPSHLRGGYEGVVSERQSPMYFRLGGGTIKGVSKPGPVVYSRVFLMDGMLQVDMGLGEAIELPDEETQRRWDATTQQLADHAPGDAGRRSRPVHGAPSLQPHPGRVRARRGDAARRRWRRRRRCSTPSASRSTSPATSTSRPAAGLGPPGSALLAILSSPAGTHVRYRHHCRAPDARFREHPCARRA